MIGVLAHLQGCADTKARARKPRVRRSVADGQTRRMQSAAWRSLANASPPAHPALLNDAHNTLRTL